MSGIRLHKKHGLNPTIPVCFWCGEDKGEVALLGAKFKGEAPREMVIDYEPCDTCKEKFKTGIQIIEATQTPWKDGVQPICNGVYPTGRWAVVKPKALTDLGMKQKHIDYVISKGHCALDPESFSKVFGGGVNANE